MLLPQKDKQKLFGYKNFYLSYYVCVKTYSRHHVDRKYRCINKFHKLSHIGLFSKWRKNIPVNWKTVWEICLRFWSVFRTKSCSLRYPFILLFEVSGAISTTPKAESSKQSFSAVKYQLGKLPRVKIQTDHSRGETLEGNCWILKCNFYSQLRFLKFYHQNLIFTCCSQARYSSQADNIYQSLANHQCKLWGITCTSWQFTLIPSKLPFTLLQH